MSDIYKDNNKLINHLEKGEEKAYIYLINTYNKLLFVYVLSLTNDHAQSEDIVQNVFFKVWASRKRLNGNYSIKSFLYKTAYNEFINQYHKNRAISVLEKVYVEAINESVDDKNSELIEKKIAIVNEGIKQLPKKCKEIFLLSKMEGLTNIEIAEHLSISTKTVEGHLTKAYNLLRNNVGDQLKKILFLLFYFSPKTKVYKNKANVL
ncbi:sigma-70 family RNA polymerase sigma factor [Mariniflexile litorale]|uniref:Sigma-70 family RNA polymerase sigma factor n=1 Tax=Mariniflexile litorale TaxID=3045158 RepID=A0AAU7ELJ6_9FLAO|nr:sigma-70 family RNA polymerase sigma factor [Mariniflexile sp. KMM 9835]MDQ8210613.1 sigma-70 family RNA polymerase sigma factor [Mariniflexile sp. KMM 9835]